MKPLLTPTARPVDEYGVERRRFPLPVSGRRIRLDRAGFGLACAVAGAALMLLCVAIVILIAQPAL